MPRDTELVAYTPENWADYDVVFVGYPIWWYDAAWPVDGFVAENDFTGKTVTEFAGIMSNPTWVKVQEGAQLARDCKADLVLAVGGGSVIDCCKIVCAQAVTDEELWDLEMVQHKAPSVPPIPLGAVVTASGTGAEMNGGAVITNEEAKIKGGMFAAAPPLRHSGPGVYYEPAPDAGALRSL